MARPGRINRCGADGGKVVISYKKFLGVGERERETQTKAQMTGKDDFRLAKCT